MVIRLGFEPKTHSLEGCCSIQLSYQTIFLRLQRYGFFRNAYLLWLKKYKCRLILLVPAAHTGDADVSDGQAFRV